MTQAEFDALLTWLDPDRDLAGEKYERVRMKLIRVFAHRGCSEPELLADQTFNRVASKLHSIAHDWVGDPMAYFYNVAQKIVFEHFRSRKVRELPPPQPVDEQIEDQYGCLEQCVSALPNEDQRLVQEYYKDSKSQKIILRQTLANELGITVNALRIRAFRLRQQLRTCVVKCLEMKPAH